MANFTLSNPSIAQMCQEVDDYLSTTELVSKERVRIVFTLEEALLQFQEKFGEDHTCQLRYGKEWGRPRISLSLPGEGFNPFATDDDTQNTQILRNLLNSTGLEPNWQYAGGRNVVFWVLPKKKVSAIAQLVMVLGLSIALGLGSYLLPDVYALAFATNVLAPLFNTFMGMLVGISGPLIFLSVTWGIYSIGDVATLGKIGKVMIGRFLLLTPVFAVITNAWMLAIYPLSQENSTFTTSSLAALYQMVLDIIPGNFVAPFYNSNPMQIICLAWVIGIAMLILGKKTTVMASFVEQSGFIVQYIMECISALVPGFIFVSVLSMFLNRQFETLASSYLPVVCMVVCSLILMVVYAVWVSVRCKVNILVLVKKLLPTFIIGVTTDSSAAAFPTNMETCEKRLGIDPKIINFGLPLGQVVFMPGALNLFTTMSLFMAYSYGVDITLPWLLMAVLVTSLVAIAAPPIPGGALTCYILVFAQLGIPDEAVALAVILNVVLGCLATGTNLFVLQCELTLLSRQLGRLDESILRKK